MSPFELQKLFLNEIPITQSMGIKVLSASTLEVQLKVGLKENKNHKGTAFGGSQYSVCALACYGLFLVGVREQGYTTNNIVIANGDIKYKAPVSSDFIVQAKWDVSTKESFFQLLEKNRKAKVELTAQILAGTQLCSEFKGSFVAIL